MGLRAKPAASVADKLANGSKKITSKLKKLSPQGQKTKSETISVSATETFITYRSSSTSAITARNSVRPKTLNVLPLRRTPTDQTKIFFGEIVDAWRAKARCNAVPADRTQELFHELSFHPNDKQISEMLQTAKMLARKRSRDSNGLTFGEFCVLAADLKRFRISTFSPLVCNKVNTLMSSLQSNTDSISNECENQTANPFPSSSTSNTTSTASKLRSTKSLSNVGDCKKRAKDSSDTSSPVEVFLGGSCNPTTWRADVAIPALKKLGITFYNPQVSDWTPDLIELEHRAKEKARVLFFVMDSETRASAGAIEAAHIAGQNCKQLVLVLHPYKPNQRILDEHISQQEYIDLTRNQMILKELVTRRGLPVLDNIPQGLQRTKEVLAGIRDPPSNIASILVVVRGAFDRVNPVNNVITFEKCQRALSYLGYAQSLINSNNLSKIIATQLQSVMSLQQLQNNEENPVDSSKLYTQSNNAQNNEIDFDLFCVISAYLSVLQQEIHENGCISPIKGTNVPPPPIYLTNMQGDETFSISYFGNRSISRNSSNASVPGNEERQSQNDLPNRSRDSGTSSPQPLEPSRPKSMNQLGKQKPQILVNIESIETTEITTTQTIHTTIDNPAQVNTAQGAVNVETSATEEESDSNDSVFSSSSSINSINYNYSDCGLSSSLEFRDVYLGGSCFLRSKWRQNIAMPFLKSNGVTFHLPALHESIQPSQLQMPESVLEDTTTVVGQEHSVKRTRRKCQEKQIEKISEESFTWSLTPIRTNLYNPILLDSSRVLLFVITNETRSLAPMTLAAHCIGLMYNVVLAVQMLPPDCVIGNEKLTPAAIKDYNRGRSYLIDLAKRQGVPVFNDIKAALECTVEKVKACNSRNKFE